jgi:hypothetical protein
MFWLITALGCGATRVAWEVRPAPSVEIDTTTVAVAAEDRGCKEVADSLLKQLDARPGVDVDPQAETRLVVESCDDFISTLVEVDGETLAQDRRRVTVTGTGELVVGVYAGDSRVGEIRAEALEEVTSAWATDKPTPRIRASSVQRDLEQAMAREVADQVAPLPEELERRVYKDAEPGTARELHNLAVDAERDGDLDQALELAKQAYVANPTARNMRYIEELESHAQTVGYVFRTE